MKMNRDLTGADIIGLFLEDYDDKKCKPLPKVTLKEALFHKNDACSYWIEAGNNNRDILSYHIFQKCNWLWKKSKYPLNWFV